jgi:hypothetical protein
MSLGGALDTVPVLREFLRSPGKLDEMVKKSVAKYPPKAR